MKVNTIDFGLKNNYVGITSATSIYESNTIMPLNVLNVDHISPLTDNTILEAISASSYPNCITMSSYPDCITMSYAKLKELQASRTAFSMMGTPASIPKHFLNIPIVGKR